MLTPSSGVLFDIGSNWGYYSVLVASRPGFSGHVHAFEPMPATFADLKSVVEQTGLASMITCHQLGISSERREAAMVFPDGLHSGGATVSLDSSNGSENVRLSPLADLDLPDPDTVKLDVEGHELHALRGADPVLRRAKPMLVMENWLDPAKPRESMEPLQLLTQMGYELFLPGWWLTDQQGLSTFDPSGRGLRADQFKELAVVPFQLEQRLLLGELVDVFACHRDRMSDLRRHFEEMPL
jgi:FkbM family methyltransferase